MKAQELLSSKPNNKILKEGHREFLEQKLVALTIQVLTEHNIEVIKDMIADEPDTWKRDTMHHVLTDLDSMKTYFDTFLDNYETRIATQVRKNVRKRMREENLL